MKKRMISAKRARVGASNGSPSSEEMRRGEDGSDEVR